jgi:putative FmdB family regulatory protein
VPIYEYLCADCGTGFEKFVRYPETDVVACPSCGRNNVVQQLSLFGFPVPGKLKPRYAGPDARDFKPHDHDD